jgi:hypothetical protein
VSQLLRSDGDPIERAYIELIERRLPWYERLWSDLIGNDGTSNLAFRKQFPKELNDQRQYTSQYIYTALVCVICAERIAQTAPKSSTLPEYLDAINQLVAFYGHLGRLRDCVKRVGELWTLRDLASPLEGLYQERNGALHDVLPPMAELYDAVVFVAPGEGEKEWGRRSKWSDSNMLDFKSITEHLQETLDQTVARLNDAFARLHSRACDDAKLVVTQLRSLAPLTNPSYVPSGSAAPGMVFGDWDLTKLRFDDDER